MASNTYEVCVDCLMFAVNGDLPEDDARAAEVLAGFDSGRMQGHLVPSGDCEGYFSWHGCDVCCSPLGGDRYDMEGII
jgi:hypothetical protein